MKTMQAVVAALVMVALAGSSYAAGKGKSAKPEKPNNAESAASEVKPDESAKSPRSPELKFSAEEQRVLDTYVHGKKAKDLPPGLRKKVARGGSLPPGWQKKLAAGEVMPIEVFRAATPLPPEVVVKLPPPPRGVVTVTIEGKAVRLLEATREILDVFEVGGRRR